MPISGGKARHLPSDNKKGIKKTAKKALKPAMEKSDIIKKIEVSEEGSAIDLTLQIRLSIPDVGTKSGAEFKSKYNLMLDTLKQIAKGVVPNSFKQAQNETKHDKSLAARTIAKVELQDDAKPTPKITEIIDAKSLGIFKTQKRKCAVFTISKNEAVILPIWVDYYAKIFGNENVYILDHQSNDGSTDDLLCNTILIKNEEYFARRWMVDMVNQFQHELLKEYETVIFVETDEFLIPNSDKYADLMDYVEKMEADVIRNVCYEVWHNPDEEPALDFTKPILKQRKYWYRRDATTRVGGAGDHADKPAITKIPIYWGLAYKAASQLIDGIHIAMDIETDEDLIFVHLHRVDYDWCLERHLWRSQQTFARSGNIMTGWHQRLKTKEEHDRSYYFDGQEYVETMPKWIKSKL